MAELRRVLTVSGRTSHTVVDEHGDALPWIEQYLAFASEQFSPNTVASYARALADWATILERRGEAWDSFASEAFGAFLAYVKHRELPGVLRIRRPSYAAKPATVQARAAAVFALYTWHADIHGLTAPYNSLFSGKRKAGRSAFKPFLTGIASQADQRRSIYRVPSGPRSRTPVLEPNQVAIILDACSTQDTSGEWSRSPAGLRDRLLFATLAETGMRVGQALSLRNHDWIIGKGKQPAIRLAARQDHPHGVRSKSRENVIFVSDDLEQLFSAYMWHLVDFGIEATHPDIATHFTFVNLAKAPYFSPMRRERVTAKAREIAKKHPHTLPGDWSPHWFRHTHATALLLSGVPPHVVQQRLGHAHVQTTLDTYGWVTQDAELQALGNWQTLGNDWRAR